MKEKKGLIMEKITMASTRMIYLEEEKRKGERGELGTSQGFLDLNSVVYLRPILSN